MLEPPFLKAKKLRRGREIKTSIKHQRSVITHNSW
jgi:hypothetical protein